MPDFKILCTSCDLELTHQCHSDLQEALIKLMTWVPEDGMPKQIIDAAKKNGFYEKGDENMPFVSQAWIYGMLGKEDARTFFSLFNNLLRSIGVDPHSSEITKKVNAIIDEREARRKRVQQLQRKAAQKNQI